jgi:prepilin-type processing-associated H-X9-DG protein
MFFDHYLRREIAQQNGMNVNSPIDAGTNKDSPDWGGNAGNPRFRHLGNKSGNFLFIDGHVEARRYVSSTRNEVLRDNVLVRSMGSNEKR